MNSATAFSGVTIRAMPIDIVKQPGERPRRHRGDIMSVEKRSALMGRIRGRGTGPERTIEQLLLSAGLVFESQARDLPGRPDFVFREERIAILVDGDFWHGWRFPIWRDKLSPSWEAKIEANRLRDVRNMRRLRYRGWTVVRIWEHQVKRMPDACLVRVLAALSRLRGCEPRLRSGTGLPGGS